ncbi:UvrB/UvrC motif-containing protein [Aquibacillus sp. 3ASR75-11]|uniref:UvrB/UvrC motif-containing protein n=1 Tax=Terrihalobacillus insolitus TaxID=2950438 RepID=A0A9X3WVB2_9BACI|nr:UvrB/UvrC motif-containing protein [Terrihalobacillus insolitus]MDC3414672.1 UvrB/UvrC motif-containing protein [Terrihalobacillus insolitus]MDC3425488.1 UvrB/UvrC motif-containing protein [Terrihalobacillus insolitus]
MECQECHERPAALHFTQVVNGDKTEVHVCEHCAKEKGYMSYGEEGYSLHHLLSGLFNFEPSPFGKSTSTSNEKISEQGLKCPKCGMTYKDFTRVGKFGCSECYQAFSDRLNPIFRRVHSGNTKHDGKIPKRIGSNLHQKKELEQYRIKLQQLIEQEAFEQAAKVRDQIKKLEKEVHCKEEGEF